MENKKKLEYYINRLKEIKDNRDDIKLIIEDSSETQENEYENNIEHQPNIKDMSLVPLFIVLVLGFNLIIYNIYSDDNIIIPFITFFISLLLLYKYVPLKAKKKFVDDFENNLKKLKNLWSNCKKNKHSEKEKYAAISSEDDQDKLINNEEQNGNNIESPLLHI